LILLNFAIRAGQSGEAEQVRPGGAPTSEAPLRNDLFLEEAPRAHQVVLQPVAAMLAIILTGSVFGGEYGDGTVRTLLMCVKRRWHVVGAKLAAVAILVAVGVGLALALGYGGALVLAAATGGAEFTFLDGAYVGEALVGALAVMSGVLPYAALAAAGAVIGRSTAAGVAPGLALYVVEVVSLPILVALGGRYEEVVNYLPTINAQVLLQHVHAENIQEEVPSAVHNLAVLAAYVVVGAGAALAVFQRRDVTTG
ncbi:MAG TPA: ABC transporter permease subunit, partial [Dehalococcoidia bacterium]